MSRALQLIDAEIAAHEANVADNGERAPSSAAFNASIGALAVLRPLRDKLAAIEAEPAEPGEVRDVLLSFFANRYGEEQDGSPGKYAVIATIAGDLAVDPSHPLARFGTCALLTKKNGWDEPAPDRVIYPSGSRDDYFGTLQTGETFGCVHFERIG